MATAMKARCKPKATVMKLRVSPPNIGRANHHSAINDRRGTSNRTPTITAAYSIATLRRLRATASTSSIESNSRSSGALGASRPMTSGRLPVLVTTPPRSALHAWKKDVTITRSWGIRARGPRSSEGGNGMSDDRRFKPGPYDEMVRSFSWEVPDRYNIATDTVDKHDPDRLAMLWEDWQGNERRLTFGDFREMSNRIANVLVGLGVAPGDRIAVLLPSTPETAAAFVAVYKTGAILLSLSQLYGDEGISHRLRDSQAKMLITDGANRGRVKGMREGIGSLEHILLVDGPDSSTGEDIDLQDAMAGASPEFATIDTSADDPAQLYYSSGTTGQAKGILHAHRYLLAHNEYELCHDARDDEIFHSTGEWAWIAGIVPGLL